jgi:MFS-type transporter involved in bile tolerance (Atg22 family)
MTQIRDLQIKVSMSQNIASRMTTFLTTIWHLDLFIPFFVFIMQVSREEEEKEIEDIV